MKMRLVLLIFILSSACTSDEESRPSAISGTWRYTTTDQKVSVTFDLEETSAKDLLVSNLEFRLDGQVFNSAWQLEGVDLPLIAKFRLNLNDANAVYPYFIEFKDCTVNVDYDVISVQKGSYTYPWGTLNTFEDVQILRMK